MATRDRYSHTPPSLSPSLPPLSHTHTRQSAYGVADRMAKAWHDRVPQDTHPVAFCAAFSDLDRSELTVSEGAIQRGGERLRGREEGGERKRWKERGREGGGRGGEG